MLVTGITNHTRRHNMHPPYDQLQGINIVGTVALIPYCWASTSPKLHRSKQLTGASHMQGHKKTCTHAEQPNALTLAPSPVQAGAYWPLSTAPPSYRAQHTNCEWGVTLCKAKTGGGGTISPCLAMGHAYIRLRTQSQAETHHSQVVIWSCHGRCAVSGASAGRVLCKEDEFA